MGFGLCLLTSSFVAVAVTGSTPPSGYKTAKSYFATDIDTKNQSTGRYLASGVALYQAGDHVKAAQHFRAAMQSMPPAEGWPAAYNLGTILYGQGRTSEARQAFVRALTGARQAKASAGEIGSIQYNLGIALEDIEGEAAGAEDVDVDAAYRSAGSNGIPLAWYNLGVRRERQRAAIAAGSGSGSGRPLKEEALECYAQAVRLNPSLHQAWSNAGSLLRLNASYESAGRAFAHAVAAARADEENVAANQSAARYCLNLAQVFARHSVKPWMPPGGAPPPPSPPTGELEPDYARAQRCAAVAVAFDPKSAVARHMVAVYGSEVPRGTKPAVHDDEEKWWTQHGPPGTMTTPTTAPSSPARAPPDFLKAIFDAEASATSSSASSPPSSPSSSVVFDEKLVNDLQYDVPQELRAIVGRLLLSEGGAEGGGLEERGDGGDGAQEPRFGRGLDLGCGTGSNGQLYRGLCQFWAGVDVSPKMAALAGARAAADPSASYHRVFEADINRVFGLAVSDSESESEIKGAGDEPEFKEAWDLIVATDSLIYYGDLSALFQAIAAHLSTDGLFAVSLERFLEGDEGGEGGTSGGESWKLQGSGTYAHSREHVVSAATAAGMAVKFYDGSHVLRLERGVPVKGHLVVFSGGGGAHGGGGGGKSRRGSSRRGSAAAK